MDVKKIPGLNKIYKTMNALMVNFILLAIVFLLLGIVIPFFPQVLDILVAAFLIISAAIFLNIAYNIHKTKKKFFGKFD